MTIVNRGVKGSALTHVELDGNFTDLVTAGATTATAVAALAARVTPLETTQYSFGWEDYSSTSPALTPSAGVRTQVLNNGLGAFTNKLYKIPGRGDIWNTTSNSFDFSNAGLVLGDTVTLRLDFTVTTNATNNGVVVELDLGTGANAYTLTLASQDWRSTGTYNLTAVAEIYMGDTNTLNNLGKIFVSSDTTGESIVYNGHFVKYDLRTASAT